MSYRIVAILSVHPSVTFRCSKKQQTQALLCLPYLVPFPRYSEILVENRNFFIIPVFDAPVTEIPIGISP